MNIRELSESLGYDAAGELNVEITGISYANLARPSDIAVIRKRRELDSTASRILLMEPFCIITDARSVIYTHEPIYNASVNVAKELMAAGVCPDYSRHGRLKPTASGAYIGEGAQIGGNVQLEVGAVIHDNALIGDNCRIGSHTIVHGGVSIACNVTIGANCSIGADALFRYKKDGRWRLFCGIGGVSIGEGVSIGNSVNVQRGTFADTKIGSFSTLGNLIDVGHDVTIGEDCFIVSQTGFAGNVAIGNNVTIYGQVGISNDVRIGNGVTVHAQSMVANDVADFEEVSGYYSMRHKDELHLLAEMRRKFIKKEI